MAPPLWASAYDNDVIGLWRMIATRREWSHRQATMHLVFAIEDPEVNNDSARFIALFFWKTFWNSVAARVCLSIHYLRDVLVVEDRLIGNLHRDIDVNGKT